MDGTRCEACGTVIPVGNLFCGKCGTRVPETPGAVTVPEDPQTAPEPPRPAGGLTPRGVNFVFIGLVLVAIIAIALTWFPSGGPSGGLTGFRVSGSGCWSGAFGNVGSSSSIGGCGSRDISWTCDGVLSGVAQKEDDGSWTLTLQVLVGGTVAESASTSEAYGAASAAASC